MTTTISGTSGVTPPAGYGVIFSGASSGTITLTSTAIAGSNTITLPAETSTLATQSYVTTALPVAATQAQQETGTATTVYVSPGRQQYHASAAKAWVNFNGTGTPAARVSQNISSITDNATGDFTVNMTTAFSSADYCVVAIASPQFGVAYGTTQIFHQISGTEVSPTASTVRLNTVTYGSAAYDAKYVMVAMFGDQS